MAGTYRIRVEISVFESDTEEMTDVMRVVRGCDIRSEEDASALGLALDDATKIIIQRARLKK